MFCLPEGHSINGKKFLDTQENENICIELLVFLTPPLTITFTVKHIERNFQ